MEEVEVECVEVDVEGGRLDAAGWLAGCLRREGRDRAALSEWDPSECRARRA